MRRNCNGYILFVVMIYLQLLSLLAMQSLTAVADDRKVMTIQMTQFRHHENALKVLAQLNNSQNVCTGRYSSTYLITKPLSWWQGHACYGEYQGQPYYFFRDVLDVDRCVSVAAGSGSRRSALYYRTILYYASDVSALVQDTFVTQSQLPVACDRPIKTIARGRQSLRWLR